MKRLICSIIILFLLSTTAFADVWLTSPANGTWTTNRHPTYEFNYDTNDSNDWFIVEVATKSYKDTEGFFYFENLVSLGLAEYPTTAWRDGFPLSTGRYYWHVLQYSYEDMTFYTSSTYRITVFKWVATRHHKKRCRKNKKYHKKKCKRAKFHKKYCRKKQI